jgi:hypothetical protein
MAAFMVKHPQGHALIAAAARKISSSMLAGEKNSVALEPDRTQ